MRPLRWLALATLPLAAGVCAQAIPQPPPGDAARGHALFLKVGCYQCHGTSGEGGGMFGPRIAPDPPPFFVFAHQLREPMARMPVYTANVLADRDLADLYAYLRSVPAAKDPGRIALLAPDPP